MNAKFIPFCGYALLVMISCNKNISEPYQESEQSEKTLSKSAVNATANARKSVYHMNLGGNTCWNIDDPESGGIESRGSVSRMDRILNEIDVHQPMIISFNEICYSQYRTIKPALNARGYDATYASTGVGGTCDNFVNTYGTGYGNALFFKGNVSDTRTYYELPHDPSKNASHLLYTEVDIEGVSTIIATTHITTDKNYTGKQIQFVAGKANEWITSGKPVILSGDFNVVPSDTLMKLMYSHSGGTGLFQEADESYSCPAPETRCRNGKPTHRRNIKIDYVFFSAAHFGYMECDTLPRFTMNLTPRSISDHNAVIGSAVWH
jgi:endonuclease/exonuclease/phosphatase family metal-dependent hydrolase